ncbi:MAG: cysteine desulfurase [Prevotella sp.]|nr:cysteine desulfurase [Prevotella sp.]
MYDVDVVRGDFPILSREVHGRQLVYLDNAATAQKPLCVLDAMREEYVSVNANVHRGVHYLSQQATELHEAARAAVRRFVNAGRDSEIVFTRGATEGINLVASCFAEKYMQAGDEVILSVAEHHSNIVPWQLQALRRGIVIKVIPFADGRLDMEAYANLFSEKTKMVSVAHVGNALGTVNPIEEIIRIARSRDVPVLVDAAQSIPHFRVDVRKLDCDFLVFSGHKIYGPTGIGVLYGKERWLEELPPYMGGGEMIARVSFEKTTFERPPLKFEAGTPDYIASHGLAVALDYVNKLGIDNILSHERELTSYAVRRLQETGGVHIFGIPSDGFDPARHGSVISFLLASPADKRRFIHHLDVGTLLDQTGIAVRTGHHCAQPLMDTLGVSGTVRVSFGLYNTMSEVDRLIESLERVRRMF